MIEKKVLREQFVKDLLAKIGADVAAGELRYDYRVLVNHWVDKIEKGVTIHG